MTQNIRDLEEKIDKVLGTIPEQESLSKETRKFEKGKFSSLAKKVNHILEEEGTDGYKAATGNT